MRNVLSIAVGTACMTMLALAPFQVAGAPAFHKPNAADDRAIRADVDSTPNTGLPVACDASGEEARRALLRMWGRDAQRYPAAYRTLETLKARGWKFPDMTSTGKPGRYGMTHAPDDFAIIHVTSTAPLFTNVTALSFSSMFVNDTDQDKYEIQTISIYTKNAAGLADTLIASGTNPDDESMRNMPVVAQSLQTGNNNPNKANVIAYTNYFGEAGGHPFCWNVRMDRDASANPLSVAVLDPTPAPGHPPPNAGIPDRTIICLNRAVADTHGEFCDYGPSQPGVLTDTLDLLFPFAGTITIANNIYTMTGPDGRTIPAIPDGKDKAPGKLRVKLIRMEGGACDASFDIDPPWKGFNVLGNKLQWQFSNPQDRTDSSQFLDAGKLSTCTDLDPTDIQDWYMIAMFFDERNGSPFHPISIGLGSLKTFDGYDANKQLLPVGYQWGCVIEGTPVTLADGRTVPIEMLKAGDLLLGPSGKSVRLSGISPGRDKKFIKLVDAAGESVVVTLDHPVLTKTGMRRARDLRAGDTVYGRNGPSILREVLADNRDTPVRVYSVHLATSDGGRIADTNDRAFYAGAILVGDYAAQGAAMRQAANERMHGKN
ncbi:Hint domain-containing protein [Bordetella bronchialis]|uniref:Hint domain-containing protein n=1 Tax=Bordetella bronchialis TaxID=463025 RepID=UPI003CFE6A07